MELSNDRTDARSVSIKAGLVTLRLLSTSVLGMGIKSRNLGTSSIFPIHNVDVGNNVILPLRPDDV